MLIYINLNKKKACSTSHTNQTEHPDQEQVLQVTLLNILTKMFMMGNKVEINTYCLFKLV